VLGVALWRPVRRACLKELEHEVIVYCKANPQIQIIEAIDVLLKQERFSIGLSEITSRH
jgi:hypothetical protein